MPQPGQTEIPVAMPVAKTIEPSLSPGNKWHFFLSHTQRNGEAKTLASEVYYEMEKKGYKCWLDVKMEEMDEDAMRNGVEKSECVLAIITGGEIPENRYFERPLCVQELKWAINAGKNIVPVVVALDKPNIGTYIHEGKTKGIDLSGCDVKHVDRSNMTMLSASLQTVISAMYKPAKAKHC